MRLIYSSKIIGAFYHLKFGGFLPIQLTDLILYWRHNRKVRIPMMTHEDGGMFVHDCNSRDMVAHKFSFAFKHYGVTEKCFLRWNEAFRSVIITICDRHMNGYGSHTFKAVNADNKPVYVKFHFKTDQVNFHLVSREQRLACGHVINSLHCWHVTIVNLLAHALQRKSDLCTPRKETARPQSQYPHSCFCKLYIYSHDRSTYLPATE